MYEAEKPSVYSAVHLIFMSISVAMLALINTGIFQHFGTTEYNYFDKSNMQLFIDMSVQKAQV